MKGEALADPREFLDRAGDLLADEARHNLIRGIVGTLIRSPDTYPEFKLFVVSEGQRPVAAATLTVPYNLIVADAATDTAIAELARTVVADGVELPGAGGNQPTIDKFVQEWRSLTRGDATLQMAQGVYSLREVEPGRPVAGSARAAGPADRAIITAWFREFFAEALPDEPTDGERSRKMITERLDGDGPNVLWLWEVDGRPVCMSGHGNPTGRGMRVGPVYTPPELRGNGYASALVAAESRWVLDNGYDRCFLYTDLANPTSNAIYERIGYRQVAESAIYGFES